MWKSKISNDEIDTIFSNVNDIQRVHLTVSIIHFFLFIKYLFLFF